MSTHQEQKGGVCFFMKVITRQKIKTVCEQNAEAFDAAFNEASQGTPNTAELKWEESVPFCVHFIWQEEEQQPETVAEEFEAQGISYKCKDCPHLEKDNDRRKKYHGCKYAVYGSVHEDEPACELFYKELIAGRLKKGK